MSVSKLEASNGFYCPDFLNLFGHYWTPSVFLFISSASDAIEVDDTSASQPVVRSLLKEFKHSISYMVSIRANRLDQISIADIEDVINRGAGRYIASVRGIWMRTCKRYFKFIGRYRKLIGDGVLLSSLHHCYPVCTNIITRAYFSRMF
ncbi:unnamed protein product [Vicia faba]|uniref:Uncharacterized protein n=1 Tax=Vicia faba TaxID=3906 RepID=A0AAV1ADR2_VICFA|nr:unnamed protein product [Vicia faba]